MKSIRHFVVAMCLSLAPLVAAAVPVNINTDTAATLAEAINGVGPKLAEAIVAYRDQNGPFESVEDLTNVKGVGVKLIDKNRDNLTTGKVK
jgi:competence protein ComEA